MLSCGIHFPHPCSFPDSWQWLWCSTSTCITSICHLEVKKCGLRNSKYGHLNCRIMHSRSQLLYWKWTKFLPVRFVETWYLVALAGQATVVNQVEAPYFLIDPLGQSWLQQLRMFPSWKALKTKKANFSNSLALIFVIVAVLSVLWFLI